MRRYLPKVSVRLFGEEEEGGLLLGGYLLEAYQEAEEFCVLLQQRVRGAGFFKTLLLRRLGSSMEAGRRTVMKLLGQDPDLIQDVDDDEVEEATPTMVAGNAVSEFKQFTDAERTSLQRCLDLLRQGGSSDPKLEAVTGYLLGSFPGLERRWLDLGCILFSQYYDTAWWVGNELAGMDAFQGLDIGLRRLNRR